MNYKKLKEFDGSENKFAILRTSPSPTTWIPFDDLNTDYIKYKEWLAEGNTPEDAD